MKINISPCLCMCTDVINSSTVLRPGDTFNYTCRCELGDAALVVNGYILAGGNQPGDEILANLSISFEKIRFENNYSGYHVTMVASYKNSGTFFTCVSSPGGCSTIEKHIFTAEGAYNDHFNK